MKSWLQHHFNEVHVFCRLRCILPVKAAKIMANVWGTISKPILYG